MAPEVAKELPYDKSVDVFSFGILLHELMSGEKPFYGYSSGKHMQQVVLGGERPKMNAQITGHWPENLKCLLKHCWAYDTSLRPSFAEIKVILQDMLNAKEDVSMSTAENPNGLVVPPGIGFIGGLLHPLSRKKTRAKTTGSSSSESENGSDLSGDPAALAKEGIKGLKPPAKAGRSRTWGFSQRR